MDFSIGVSVFVKDGSGDAFSTASGCKGCKTSVVLVSMEVNIDKVVKNIS